jgi:hypothetical protein
MAIGPHVCDSWNITKQKKTEKNNAMPIYKISFFKYGIGFSLKIFLIYAFNIKSMQKKTHFWMKFHPKTLNLCMVLDQYHAP